MINLLFPIWFQHQNPSCGLQFNATLLCYHVIQLNKVQTSQILFKKTGTVTVDKQFETYKITHPYNTFLNSTYV